MGGALFDSSGSYTMPFLLGVAANCVNLVIVGMLLTKTRKSEPPEPVGATA
jgi:hypothetical protein